MTSNDYLYNVLCSQNLDLQGKEMTDLEKRRQEVEALLRKQFGSVPTIRYGGSKAKGTMIKESYDLDIVCYFPHDATCAGETLKEIYNNVLAALNTSYLVEPKGSALRLTDRSQQNYRVDFHIDVVPGRFVDDTETDTLLFRLTGEKEYLKTNLEVHINHIKKSGVVDAIRLMKLWRVRNAIHLKNFILDLLVIELLQDKKNLSLADQLIYVWEEFRDHYKSLSVQDPANPYGNDLSAELEAARMVLHQVASATLQQLYTYGWEAVFGKVESGKGKLDTLWGAASTTPKTIRPWGHE